MSYMMDSQPYRRAVAALEALNSIKAGDMTVDDGWSVAGVMKECERQVERVKKAADRASDPWKYLDKEPWEYHDYEV